MKGSGPLTYGQQINMPKMNLFRSLKPVFILSVWMATEAVCAKYPIDTSINIPDKGYPAAEIRVFISQLDTDLVFFTSPGTLSCPGGATGDIKGVIKKPTSANPNVRADYPLWELTANCDGSPNRYAS